MPYGLILLGRNIPLALHREDMQQLRPLDVAQGAQRAYQLGNIVAVDRTKVAEVQTLEEVATTHHHLLQRIAHLAQHTLETRNTRKEGPHALLEAVVVARGGDLRQVAFQGSRGGVDRHVVIVENHQKIRVACRTGVVQPLEGQTARHRAIANDRHYLTLLAIECRRLRHTEGCRDRNRGMTATKGVVGALVHARETAQSVELALREEGLATPRDDLVGVGLMPHIPHELILGRIEDIVQRRSQLHCTEARGQVTGIDRAGLDDVATQLLAIRGELLDREGFQLLGRVDLIE